MKPQLGKTDDVKPRAVEAQIHNGAPALIIEGRPVPALVVDLGSQVSERGIESGIRSAVAAGVRLFRLRNVDLGWLGQGEFDYSPLLQRLTTLEAAAPNARILIEVHVDPPQWWLRQHPAECARFASGAESDAELVVSWASRRWRNEAGAALARLVRAVQTGEHGSSVIAWQAACGPHGDWRHARAEEMPDTGPAMQEQFRIWAAEKYRRNTGLLRKAWFDTRAEFPEIVCPSAEERRRAHTGVLRNPIRSRRILDYYECLFTQQNTSAAAFCSHVRKACDGKALVAISFGSLFENGSLPEQAYGLPEAVLDSDDVGLFIQSGSREGAYLRGLNGSLALRGKLVIHTTPPGSDVRKAGAMALSMHAGLAAPVATAAETLRGVREGMERALNLSARIRRRESPLAIVVDAANMAYIGEAPDQPNPLNHLHLTAQMEEVTRLGVPFDTYLVSDLFHPKLPNYKVFLFLNTFYLSEAERRRIDARIKRSGQTAVWLWGAGLIGEEGVTAEYAGRLCGQKIRTEYGQVSMRVRIADANDPLTWGQHPGLQFGPERAVGPIVTVSDKAITRLGANTDNKTVFSVRRFEEWTSVVVGTAPLPAHLLRNLLRSCNAHLYVDDPNCVVFADSCSVAVATQRGGAMRISLPGQFDVIDGWTGRLFAQNVSEFDTEIAPGDTARYELKRRGGEAARAAALPADESEPPVAQPSVTGTSRPPRRRA